MKKLLLIPLTLVFIGAGCQNAAPGSNYPSASNSNVPTTTASKKKACEYVTAADASAVLGGTATLFKDEMLGLYSSCSYQYQPTPTSINMLTVQIRQSGFSAADFDKSTAMAASGVNVTRITVPGIGDAAYSVGGALLVLKGQTEFTVLVFSPGKSEAQKLSAEKTIAAKIVAKL